MTTHTRPREESGREGGESRAGAEVEEGRGGAKEGARRLVLLERERVVREERRPRIPDGGKKGPLKSFRRPWSWVGMEQRRYETSASLDPFRPISTHFALLPSFPFFPLTTSIETFPFHSIASAPLLRQAIDNEAMGNVKSILKSPDQVRKERGGEKGQDDGSSLCGSSFFPRPSLSTSLSISVFADESHSTYRLRSAIFSQSLRP